MSRCEKCNRETETDSCPKKRHPYDTVPRMELCQFCNPSWGQLQAYGLEDPDLITVMCNGFNILFEKLERIEKLLINNDFTDYED